MLAAEVYVQEAKAVICAKLHHHSNKRCIFNCGYRAMRREQAIQVSLPLMQLHGITYTIEDVIAEDYKVVSHGTFTGTHRR